jgi:hypothetical protein
MLYADDLDSAEGHRATPTQLVIRSSSVGGIPTEPRYVPSSNGSGDGPGSDHPANCSSSANGAHETYAGGARGPCLPSPRRGPSCDMRCGE